MQSHFRDNQTQLSLAGNVECGDCPGCLRCPPDMGLSVGGCHTQIRKLSIYYPDHCDL